MSYAIANALFGGTAEYVALFLRASGMETAFFSYVAGICSVSAMAAFLMPDLSSHGYLDGDGGGTKYGLATGKGQSLKQGKSIGEGIRRAFSLRPARRNLD